VSQQTFELNSEQNEAVSRMAEFLTSSRDSFFLLNGAAGTGKTTTVKELVARTRNLGKLVFTAPTNKATKVLSSLFSGLTFNGEEGEGRGYYAECRTIYSVLGLRMEPNGAIKELTHPDDPIDLSDYLAVVVDEASMINTQLWEYIQNTAEEQGVKFVFLGDDGQLPPVKEARSPIWSLEPFTLKKVMRHDNQILTLATALRKTMDSFAPQIKLVSDNDGTEGVWKVPSTTFENMIIQECERGTFQTPTGAKAIAWRNVTVDALNSFIRRRIWGNAVGDYFPGDRIIVVEPIMREETVKDRRIKKTLATTDSEATVERTEVDNHPLYPKFLCHHIVAQLDAGSPIELWVLHPESYKAYQLETQRLSAEAKVMRHLWKDFWKFKEAFHSIRYGYALTAHRSQGSTYDRVFVNAGDVLRNPNRSEAFRCLYVACTRPRKQLILLS